MDLFLKLVTVLSVSWLCGYVVVAKITTSILQLNFQSVQWGRTNVVSLIETPVRKIFTGGMVGISLDVCCKKDIFPAKK